MKQSEIAELSTPELIENIDEKTVLLGKMKLNHSVSEDENPIKIRFARRTVARLRTELKSRQLAEAAK
ncbi:MAG: large subunit ribosomal protein L29 [Parvicellaceae bacterium]|jgi:large subunit ribosomal protein L29